MFVNIPHSGFWFCLCLAVVIATSIIMSRQASHFYYLDETKKKFSIFNIEFPQDVNAISGLISKIRSLPGKESQVVFKALRGQLYVDFLFMPATYLGILIACMGASGKLTGNWAAIFIWLGCLQLFAWSLDITENLILLRQILQPSRFSNFAYCAYWLLEIFKWGLSVGGFVTSSSVLIYHFINRK